MPRLTVKRCTIASAAIAGGLLIGWLLLPPPAAPLDLDRSVSLTSQRLAGINFLCRADGQGLSQFEIRAGSFAKLLERAAPDQPSHPAVANLNEAKDFCRALSEQTGRNIRLPSAAEWEGFARAGDPSRLYPWGAAPPNSERAVYGGDGAKAVGSRPANPQGFHDLAGNVYEWTTEGVAKGGSWAERDPAFFRIGHSMDFPTEYRGPDVGFRVLVEKE